MPDQNAPQPCPNADDHPYLEGMPEGGGKADGAVCATCRLMPQPPEGLYERCRLTPDEAKRAVDDYGETCNTVFEESEAQPEVVAAADAATRKAAPIAYAAGYKAGLAANKVLLRRCEEATAPGYKCCHLYNIAPTDQRHVCVRAGCPVCALHADIRRARGEQTRDVEWCKWCQHWVLKWPIHNCLLCKP